MLASLGVIDDTPGGRARLEALQTQVADRPDVIQMLNDQVQAARGNPFLQVPPADPQEYVEFLADRLDYAERIGDTSRAAQVLEQSRQFVVSILDDAKVTFQLPGTSKPNEGHQVAGG